MQLLTFTLFAEVASKRPDLQEAQEREKLSNSVLHRRTRQTPLIVGLEGETCAGNTCGSLL